VANECGGRLRVAQDSQDAAGGVMAPLCEHSRCWKGPVWSVESSAVIISRVRRVASISVMQPRSLQGAHRLRRGRVKNGACELVLLVHSLDHGRLVADLQDVHRR
jgi:hypothetical protein